LARLAIFIRSGHRFATARGDTYRHGIDGGLPATAALIPFRGHPTWQYQPTPESANCKSNSPSRADFLYNGV